jgi:hypothetical protein
LPYSGTERGCDGSHIASSVVLCLFAVGAGYALARAIAGLMA